VLVWAMLECIRNFSLPSDVTWSFINATYSGEGNLIMDSQGKNNSRQLVLDPEPSINNAVNT
jgi:hypothetical protein